MYRLLRWTRRGCTPTAGSPMMATADRTRSWAVCAGRLFRKGQCCSAQNRVGRWRQHRAAANAIQAPGARLTWPRRARYSRIGCLKGAGDHLPAQLVDRADAQAGATAGGSVAGDLRTRMASRSQCQTQQAEAKVDPAGGDVARPLDSDGATCKTTRYRSSRSWSSSPIFLNDRSPGEDCSTHVALPFKRTVP